jgi:hypothetical protein
MKRQRGADPIDPLGDTMPELSRAIALTYPEGTGGREHYFDPLQPLNGPVENVTPGQKQPKRKKRTAIGPLSEQDAALARARLDRYDRFIDSLLANHGDQVRALAETYGVPREEIESKFNEYRTDVQTGMSTSSVSDLLEKHGIGKAARIAILRTHVYSLDPKESLVALKMAVDLDGDKHDRGTSYESYLRVVMGRA